MNRIVEAQKLIEESLELDRFNLGVLFERSLLAGDSKFPLGDLGVSIPNIHTFIEFALDYAFAGLYDEAINLVSAGIEEQNDKLVYPMAWYYKAWFEAQAGHEQASKNSLAKASKSCPEYCFPNQIEAAVVLEWAKQLNPADSKAPYYLGNFWYNARQYDDAVANWELSAKLDDGFATVHRNLSLAYFNKQNKPQKALAELEKAFSLDETDSRILMELDQLYKRLGYLPESRLEKFEKYPEQVNYRDDLYLERATLYNQLGQFEKAYGLIMSRKFHPWEGGEGKVTGQYVFSLTEMAKKAIQEMYFSNAIELLEKAQIYPENLGEGKLYGAQENAIFYWLGNACSGMSDHEKARYYWEKASSGIREPVPAIFYNDQQPDTIFYQGLALIQLGRIDEAKARFNKLIDFGKTHLNDEFKLDYFAVSLPDLQIWDDDLTKRNHQNCLNLIALGDLGLSQIQDKK